MAALAAMVIVLVSATAPAASAADRPAADLVVTALVPDLVALVVMDLADLAAMIVVTMTAAHPALKTHRTSVPSTLALSSPMT